jgi:hypothetical protein
MVIPAGPASRAKSMICSRSRRANGSDSLLLAPLVPKSSRRASTSVVTASLLWRTQRWAELPSVVVLGIAVDLNDCGGSTARITVCFGPRLEDFHSTSHQHR